MTMKTILTAAFLLLPGLVAAQAQPAGRVLALAGEATLSRAGQQLPLRAGVMVESGDVLAVGERSALQVRFTDESVVALRANSQFRIEDYRFDKNVEQDRSVMGLLKGGMRTITGLIGKANQKNYMVRTATSTIGIRGTHFTVVSCNNDCRNTDGTLGLNGTFGGVTDGRITVSNSSGQHEFRQQDYFHVPSADATPVRLLAPPAILNDRSSGARGRTAASTPAAGSGGAVAGGETVAESNSGTQTSTSPQLTVQTAPGTQLLAPLTTIAANEQPNVSSGGNNNQITVVETRMPDMGQIEANARNYSVLQLRGEVSEISGIRFNDAASLAAAFRSIGRPVGASAAAAAYWMYDAPDSGSNTRLGSHHAWGDTPQIQLPGSGTAQYNYVGGTAPTDNYGRVGSFSGSNLLMDFGARQIKTSNAMSMSFGTNALQSTATVYVIPTNTTWQMGGGPQPLAGTNCVSGCAAIGTTKGFINGRFVGTALQGYAAAITVGNSQLTTSQPNVAGNVATFAKQ
jgi:hypothetical protein